MLLRHLNSSNWQCPGYAGWWTPTSKGSVFIGSYLPRASCRVVVLLTHQPGELTWCPRPSKGTTFTVSPIASAHVIHCRFVRKCIVRAVSNELSIPLNIKRSLEVTNPQITIICCFPLSLCLSANCFGFTSHIFTLLVQPCGSICSRHPF